jgi:hypothetical protein
MTDIKICLFHREYRGSDKACAASAPDYEYYVATDTCAASIKSILATSGKDILFLAIIESL